MPILTLLSYRPNSGRTTSALHLAQAASLTGLRALLIDCTADAELSRRLGLKRENCDLTSQAFISTFGNIGRISSSIIAADIRPGLDIIPAPHHGTSKPLNPKQLSSEARSLLISRVRTALKLLSRRYDVVVVDTDDIADVLSQAAIGAASVLVAPVSLSPGFAEATELLERISLHGKLTKAFVLKTFTNSPDISTPPDSISKSDSQGEIISDRVQLVNERNARRNALGRSSEGIAETVSWSLLTGTIPRSRSVSLLADLHLSAFDLGDKILNPEILATVKSQNEKSKENQQAILSELAPEEVREFARAYMTATEEVLAVMERPGEAQNSGQPNAVAWNSTTRLRVAGLD